MTFTESVLVSSFFRGPGFALFQLSSSFCRSKNQTPTLFCLCIGLFMCFFFCQALIHGLNRHYYSIAINYRKNELEQKVGMLCILIPLVIT